MITMFHRHRTDEITQKLTSLENVSPNDKKYPELLIAEFFVIFCAVAVASMKWP
jgi:hypothetical protein